MNLAYFCSKARLWLLTYIFRGEEGHLSLLERLTGRSYYFVALCHDGKWEMSSTIFHTRQTALRFAKRARTYQEFEGRKIRFRIIRKRRWVAYKRVICNTDLLAGNYRKSYAEQIKALRHDIQKKKAGSNPAANGQRH